MAFCYFEVPRGVDLLDEIGFKALEVVERYSYEGF